MCIFLCSPLGCAMILLKSQFVYEYLGYYYMIVNLPLPKELKVNVKKENKNEEDIICFFKENGDSFKTKLKDTFKDYFTKLLKILKTWILNIYWARGYVLPHRQKPKRSPKVTFLKIRKTEQSLFFRFLIKFIIVNIFENRIYNYATISN